MVIRGSGKQPAPSWRNYASKGREVTRRAPDGLRRLIGGRLKGRTCLCIRPAAC